jgi:tetratricopeptide (TPR) repeat protein
MNNKNMNRLLARAGFVTLFTIVIAGACMAQRPGTTAGKTDRKEAERLAVSGNSFYEAALKSEASSTAAINEQNFKKALDELNRAVAADPSYEASYRVRSLLYLHTPGTVEQKRLNADLAVKDCESSIVLNAKNADAFKCRGVAYDEIAGRLNDKFKNFMEEFTARTYKDPKWFDSKGRSRAELYGLAIADFTTAITLKANYQLHFLRGYAYLGKADLENARADFAESFRLNPSFTSAKEMLGVVERQLAEAKPAVRPKPSSFANITGDWEATLTMYGRESAFKLSFANSRGDLSGKLVISNGKSFDLKDIAVNADRTFSFKMFPAPTVTDTFTGTVDAAFQNLTGSLKREMNGHATSATFKAMRQH